MEITDIRVRLVTKDDSKLKAVVSFTIDDAFVVHDVKVVEVNGTAFMAMPSKLGPDGKYRDTVHPKNTETRQMIEAAVLKAYEQELANPTRE